MSNDDERDRAEELQDKAEHARHGGCFVGSQHDPGRLHPGEDNSPLTGIAYND
jgi:hypothetical protein